MYRKVALDSKMGFPEGFNSDTCYQWLSSLGAIDHLRLVFYELEKVYYKAGAGSNFRKWMALIVWSIIRASDDFLASFFKADAEFKGQNVEYVRKLMEKGYDGLTAASLDDLLKVSRQPLHLILLMQSDHHIHAT